MPVKKRSKVAKMPKRKVVKKRTVKKVRAKAKK